MNQAFDHSNESSLMVSPTIRDLNISDIETKNMRILWLRNIKRIQIQVKINLPADEIKGNGDF